MAWGGWNGGYLTTNEAYDPVANSWSTKQIMLTARMSLAAATVNNVIYAIGGSNGGISYLASNEVYNPNRHLYIFTKN